MRDIIWDNIWPCKHQGIFLWVADGEVYGTDITKDEAQRKGHNCWQGKETFVKKIVPPLTLKECSLSQITHILLSAKPQHSHWSRKAPSKSIPWQDLTSGFTTQQVSQGCDSLGSGTITTPFPAVPWRVKCKYGKTGFFAKVLHAILPTFSPRCPELPLRRRNYSTDFPTLICPHPPPFIPWCCLWREQGLRCLSPFSCSRATPCCTKPFYCCPYVSSNLPGSSQLSETNGGCSSGKIRFR